MGVGPKKGIMTNPNSPEFFKNRWPTEWIGVDIDLSSLPYYTSPILF